MEKGDGKKRGEIDGCYEKNVKKYGMEEIEEGKRKEDKR